MIRNRTQTGARAGMAAIIGLVLAGCTPEPKEPPTKSVPSGLVECILPDKRPRTGRATPTLKPQPVLTSPSGCIAGGGYYIGQTNSQVDQILASMNRRLNRSASGLLFRDGRVLTTRRVIDRCRMISIRRAGENQKIASIDWIPFHVPGLAVLRTNLQAQHYLPIRPSPAQGRPATVFATTRGATEDWPETVLGTLGPPLGISNLKPYRRLSKPLRKRFDGAPVIGEGGAVIGLIQADPRPGWDRYLAEPGEPRTSFMLDGAELLKAVRLPPVTKPIESSDGVNSQDRLGHVLVRVFCWDLLEGS